MFEFYDALFGSHILLSKRLKRNEVKNLFGDFHYFKNFVNEDWNILFYSIPHSVNVNAEIVMDQFIPHPSNFFPGNVRIPYFQSF